MSAPTFALLAGIACLALGFAGIFSGGAALGGLDLFLGLWGFVAWAGALGAVNFARAGAFLFALVALFAAQPAYGAWGHGLLAVAAAYIGFRSLLRRPRAAARPAERRHTAAPRRQAARPVARERRKGPFDRRYGLT